MFFYSYFGPVLHTCVAFGARIGAQRRKKRELGVSCSDKRQHRMYAQHLRYLFHRGLLLPPAVVFLSGLAKGTTATTCLREVQQRHGKPDAFTYSVTSQSNWD